ncbi:tyrosine-type recombinase/integrase [Pseudonocardia hydrocarbonoxydans]|uniref:Tyr recombinase domain-containing protein n=1 Tax=Pseudonocardia hydrocarbonoxydans TaxID=76726 RepID=A0A4Y3WRB8_9PSEU|nr:site-specific integrase [Pseudonocardia hydrocarbonoxydans]GEC20811.1 hypothetical protein PHY01_30940 [Pseudonocardia hydrocarbonoxydans]
MTAADRVPPQHRVPVHRRAKVHRLPAIVDNLPGAVYRTQPTRYLIEHLDWMRRAGRADSTIKARTMALHFLALWLHGDPFDATSQQLDAWQSTLKPLIKMRHQTSLIRPYYRFVQDRGYRLDNPAALLPLPPAPRRLPRPISEERLMAAVAAARPRVLRWLLLAGWSGLRAAEIAGLTVESFAADGTGQVWARVMGKGSKEREVPVPAWCWELIEPALPASGPCWAREKGTGPVTAQHVSQLCNDYLRSQGMSDTFHALRHRAATETLHATGGDLRAVQDLLGHSNLGTLHVYTRVRPGTLAGAVAALGRPTDELR